MNSILKIFYPLFNSPAQLSCFVFFEMASNNTASDYSPQWSPDGSKIAFYSNRDDVNREIYVMDADGSNQTRLTNNSADDYAPQWSPDGSKIAFISNRDGNEEIYVMDADGSNQTNLTNNSAGDYQMDW